MKNFVIAKLFIHHLNKIFGYVNVEDVISVIQMVFIGIMMIFECPISFVEKEFMAI